MYALVIRRLFGLAQERQNRDEDEDKDTGDGNNEIIRRCLLDVTLIEKIRTVIYGNAGIPYGARSRRGRRIFCTGIISRNDAL